MSRAAMGAHYALNAGIPSSTFSVRG